MSQTNGEDAEKSPPQPHGKHEKWETLAGATARDKGGNLKQLGKRQLRQLRQHLQGLPVDGPTKSSKQIICYNN